MPHPPPAIRLLECAECPGATWHRVTTPVGGVLRDGLDTPAGSGPRECRRPPQLPSAGGCPLDSVPAHLNRGRMQRLGRAEQLLHVRRRRFRSKEEPATGGRVARSSGRDEPPQARGYGLRPLCAVRASRISIGRRQNILPPPSCVVIPLLLTLLPLAAAARGPTASTFAGLQTLVSEPCLTTGNHKTARICRVEKLQYADGSLSDELWLMPASEPWYKKAKAPSAFGFNVANVRAAEAAQRAADVQQLADALAEASDARKAAEAKATTASPADAEAAGAEAEAAWAHEEGARLVWEAADASLGRPDEDLGSPWGPVPEEPCRGVADCGQRAHALSRCTYANLGPERGVCLQGPWENRLEGPL